MSSKEASGPPRGLRHALALRLGLWYVALFIVSAVSLFGFTYLLLARTLTAQDRDVLDSTAARYAAEYRLAGLTSLQQLIEADAGEGRHDRLLVRVVKGSRDVVYFAAPAGWSAFDLSGLDEPQQLRGGWTGIANPADGSVLEVRSIALGDNVTVQVGRSSLLRDELLRHFRARALEVMALVVLVAVAGGSLLTYVGLAPLRALDSTVRSILVTGRFDARVPTRQSRDPLDELGRLVNDMLGRIQTLVTGMRGALDNVAHDLRTPLTRFRNVAEAAIVQDDAQAMREGLARALEEAHRVNATLTALMDISEAETGTMKLEYARISLAAVVEEAATLYADEVEDKCLALSIAIDPSITLVADRARLRQVFANLMENAIKYTNPGGHVDISAEEANAFVTIAIRDTGIGIAANDLPLVWDRLYRADASRAARGLGLGLSLVKAIVEGHGGRVGVESILGSGSVFRITLPTEGGVRL